MPKSSANEGKWPGICSREIGLSDKTSKVEEGKSMEEEEVTMQRWEDVPGMGTERIFLEEVEDEGKLLGWTEGFRR